MPSSAPLTNEPSPSAGPPATAASNGFSRLQWLLLLAAALVMVTYIVRPTDEINGHSPAVGHPAPELRLVAMGLDEESPEWLVQNSSRPGAEAGGWKTAPLEGRVTVLHFWGTWCGPCRRELPELAEVHARLTEHPDYQFFSVTCAAFDDPSLSTLEDRTRRFYESVDVQLPTFADPTAELRRELLRLMEQEAMGYPTTVVIDRRGVIRATWVGIPPGGAETIARRVEELLADDGG